MSSVDVARLVLDYCKVFLWPIVVVIALFWLGRTNLPDLIRRLKSAEGFGAKVEFTQAERQAITKVTTDLTEVYNSNQEMYNLSRYLFVPAGRSKTEVARSHVNYVQPSPSLAAPQYSPINDVFVTTNELALDLAQIVRVVRGFYNEESPILGPNLYTQVPIALRQLRDLTGLPQWDSLADSYNEVIELSSESSILNAAARQGVAASLAQQVSTAARALVSAVIDKRLLEIEAEFTDATDETSDSSTTKPEPDSLR
jgi:hypothetical protein